jgi:hypothetical protein
LPGSKTGSTNISDLYPFFFGTAGDPAEYITRKLTVYFLISLCERRDPGPVYSHEN